MFLVVGYMLRGLLTIQVLTVSSENAVSIEGQIVDDHQFSLDVEGADTYVS